MIGEEHTIQAGKFAGCLPSDIPAEELGYWSFRGASTALDRLALQDRYRALHRRRRPASEVSPNPGARTAGHSFGVGGGMTAGAR